MGDSQVQTEFPDQKQRLAVCFSKAGESVQEASLAMNMSHYSLGDYLRKALQVELGVSDSYYYDSPSVVDIFPGFVVYSFKGQMYKRSYTVSYGSSGSTPKISLGAEKKIHTAYVDSKDGESESIFYGDDKVIESFSGENVTVTLQTAENVVMESVAMGEYTPVKESAVEKVPIKIIGPGWGAMAYYSEAMIKGSGPKAFPKGTHMYWNHPTATEEAERPERNLDDLAAITTKDAFWDNAGAKGPGLYTEAKVFSDHAQQLEDKGPYIGCSIVAALKSHEGSAEGKTGRIADEFLYGFSTDFVTKAGAGGAPVMESQRDNIPPIEEGEMTKEEIKAAAEKVGFVVTEAAASLKQDDPVAKENAELKSQLAKLETQGHISSAMKYVTEALTKAEVEFSSKLIERACAVPVIKEGKLDEEWLKGIVADFTTESSPIQGVGPAPTREAAKETGARMRESMKRLGVPEAGLGAASSIN
jgi:hypothetical protein